MAQRLVRVIARNARLKCPARARRALSKLGEDASALLDFDLYEGKGCSSCRLTGFRGRTAIMNSCHK